MQNLNIALPSKYIMQCRVIPIVQIRQISPVSATINDKTKLNRT